MKVHLKCHRLTMKISMQACDKLPVAGHTRSWQMWHTRDLLKAQKQIPEELTRRAQ